MMHPQPLSPSKHPCSLLSAGHADASPTQQDLSAGQPTQRSAVQAGVGVIVSLQQDKDLQHWGVNLWELQNQAEKHRITYQRCPVRLPAPRIPRLVACAAPMLCACSQSHGIRLASRWALGHKPQHMRFNALLLEETG